MNAYPAASVQRSSAAAALAEEPGLGQGVETGSLSQQHGAMAQNATSLFVPGD
jgi:hypothetical protein